MDERHLSKEIPRSKCFEQARFAVIDALGHFHVTLEDHVKALFDGILAAQYLARQIGTDLAVGDQLFDLIGSDAREGSGYDLGWGSACSHLDHSISYSLF
jgi:hypothetical protein